MIEDNVPAGKLLEKKIFKKIIFLASLKFLKKGVGSGSIIQRYGSVDPDPHKMSRIHNTATIPEIGLSHETLQGWIQPAASHSFPLT
jgi:hypothetical protein